MNTWKDFLTTQTFAYSRPADAATANLYQEWDLHLQKGGFLCDVANNGLILVEGADAASFLHAQLSNDIIRQPSDQARLAAYCSVKGRMLASFLTWKSGEQVFLQLPRDLVAPTQKRLSMFVLRAKAKLSDVSEQWVSLGLAGETAVTALAKWFAPFEQIYQRREHADASLGSVIRLPNSLGCERFQWTLPIASAAEIWQTLAQSLPCVASPIWDLYAIHSGVAKIEAQTVDQFVPQMVNYELVGGVNFKKGCYPGQEIVARSQYLGKLKRHMYLAHLEQPEEVLPGQEVFSSADPGQACGMVVNAAPNPRGGYDCLLELKSALIEAGEMRVAGGSACVELLPLPYPRTGEI